MKLLVMEYSALYIYVLKDSALDIFAMEYFLFHRNFFQWLQYLPYRWTCLKCDIICISGMEYSALDISVLEYSEHCFA